MAFKLLSKKKSSQKSKRKPMTFRKKREIVMKIVKFIKLVVGVYLFIKPILEWLSSSKGEGVHIDE